MRSPVRVAIVKDYAIVVAGVAAILAGYVDRVAVVEPDAQVPVLADWPGRDVGLNPREAEVISLICQGLTNQEIADRAFLSINSVKTYIRSAYRKMGVAGRVGAVSWSLQNGFQPDQARTTARDITAGK